MRRLADHYKRRRLALAVVATGSLFFGAAFWIAVWAAIAAFLESWS